MVFLFYFFITIVLVGTYKAVNNANPVYSIFYLIFSFCSAAALLILLELEFISLLLILIYVGAIAVLFLFVIIMLNVQTTVVRVKKIENVTYLVILIFCFFLINRLITLESYNQAFFKIIDITPTISWVFDWCYIFDKKMSVALVGKVLFFNFTVTFLIAGLLLLISIIASVVLTVKSKKQKTNLKNLQQKVYYQLSRTSTNAIFRMKK